MGFNRMEGIRRPFKNEGYHHGEPNGSTLGYITRRNKDADPGIITKRY